MAGNGVKVRLGANPVATVLRGAIEDSAREYFRSHCKDRDWGTTASALGTELGLWFKAGIFDTISEELRDIADEHNRSEIFATWLEKFRKAVQARLLRAAFNRYRAKLEKSYPKPRGRNRRDTAADGEDDEREDDNDDETTPALDREFDEDERATALSALEADRLLGGRGYTPRLVKRDSGE